jgi:Cof subfamily protein (haloacid dehalogenase superfamily)
MPKLYNNCSEHDDIENSASRIKLVACDLDGTLLGPGGTGIDAAREAVDLCRALGLEFTIATGRAFGSVEKFLIHLGLVGRVITNGGAMVAALGKDPIYHRTIDASLASVIADHLRALKLPFYFIVGKDMLTEWEGPETAEYSANLSFDIRVVDSLAPLGLSPTQIAVRVPAGVADSLVCMFKERWGGRACIIKSLPHLIEFQASGVSKASALEYLASSLGVHRSEVLAVGDGLNDMDMLVWAGCSACVGNACPEVRAVSDHVSQALYAEGVLEVIKKIIGNLQ